VDQFGLRNDCSIFRFSRNFDPNGSKRAVMARRVDPALTKRAIAALKRAAEKANQTPEGLSDWEAEFLTSLDSRLNTYGSAFANPDKGQLSAPLSLRQGLKVRQIAKKGERASAATKPKKPAKPLVRKSGLVSKGFKRKGAK
jgi:hypothetical protein